MDEGNVCSFESLKKEHVAKRARVASFLQQAGFGAVLISRHENIAWLTAGLCDTRVGLLRETGAASLLVTNEGQCYLLTTNNELSRFMEEDFAGLDVEPIVQPWYSNDVQASVRKVAGDGAVATDNAAGALTVVTLQPLRLSLTEGEVERYRWVGARVAETTTALLRDLTPGMSEQTIQARMAERLIAQGLLPSVYLGATDDRVLRYRHPVPRRGVLERYGMVCFCARRWGLTASITRFVHFGTLPGELSERFGVVTEVNAKLQAASRDGVDASELYDVAKRAYAAAGYADGETMHHQGGATGYLEREWIARRGGAETVASPQAFAWNPSLLGAKVEDTVILQNGSIEVLTATPELPVVETRVNGVSYRAAGVLIR